MIVQLRRILRLDSSLSRHSTDHATSSPPIRVGVARSVRGMLALVLAALAYACGGSAWAQSSAMPTATPTEPAPVASPAPPPFELKSPWDAPEPWRTDRYYFQFAYYTIHFHYDEDHQQSYLFDAEYHFKETLLGGQWIAGMALFQNSFGQFSQYLFGGLLWRPIEEHQPFYVKLHGRTFARIQRAIPGQGAVQQFRCRARDHSQHGLLREAVLRRIRAARHQCGAAYVRHVCALGQQSANGVGPPSDRSLPSRQREGERRARAQLARHPYLPAVKLDELAGNGKSQAGPLDLLRG